jgi:hypothetical protein
MVDNAPVILEVLDTASPEEYVLLEISIFEMEKVL